MPTGSDEREVEEPLSMSWSPARVLAVIAALAMLAFWGLIFSGLLKRDNPDKLDDRAWTTQAERRCKRLLDDLDGLPQAHTSKDQRSRAVIVQRANGMVEAMVRDLRADAPTAGDDGRSLRGWFRDWDTYLQDRRSYVTELRTEKDPRFSVSENKKLKDGVDQTIKVFADVNDMPSCATPGDVG